MRKVVFIGLGILLVFVIILGINANITDEPRKVSYIRIHIRADSNLERDQNVKYGVKDAIVDYLAPCLAEAESFAESMSVISARLSGIERAADKVLRANGVSYTARARLGEETFPARSYDGITLDSGVYDALIVELGAGAGDNWWCVVYPPLCFLNAKGTDGDGITYKSKIMEIIRKLTG
ncbi:MAG: stage II sporulation protein R [Clostridiales bacterium]|jgi:stage II sporulation protein R|nr:stage II sporulation protein R [Clostridiales bacterium]